MKLPKANTPREKCHVCGKKTVYALEIDQDPKPTCPACITEMMVKMLGENISWDIRTSLYAGFHTSVHTAGHMLDIHFMIPTNAVYMGGWPLVVVTVNPISQEMESALHRFNSQHDFLLQVQDALLHRCLLEPEGRQPANEGSDDGENHQSDNSGSSAIHGKDSEDGGHVSEPTGD